MSINEYLKNLSLADSRRIRRRMKKKSELPFKHGDETDAFKAQHKPICDRILKKKKHYLHAGEGMAVCLIDHLIGARCPYLDKVDNEYWHGIVTAMACAFPDFHGIFDVPYSNLGCRFILTIEAAHYWENNEPRVAVALHGIREEPYKSMPNRPVSKIYPWWWEYPSDDAEWTGFHDGRGINDDY